MSNGFLSFFNKPDALPQESALTLTSPGDILKQFLSQSGQVGQLNGLAKTLNTDENQNVQGAISGIDPSLIPNVGALGTNTASLLSGKIPQDVLDQISMSTAEQSLAGGYGGSNMAHALTARDLGLTSLDLQQKGAGNLSLENGLDQALTPGRSSAASMLLSPTSLQQADYTADQYNNQITNQNKQIQYANDQLVSPFSRVVGNTLGAVVSAPFNFVQNELGNFGAGAPAGAPAGSGVAASSSGSSGSGGGMGGMLGGLLGGGGGAAGGAGAAAMCCFIFLEALNGELPSYARLARDTRGSNATIRGYRWMSRWLVPAMRLSRQATALVNTIMVRPMLACGRDYFTDEKSAWGKACKANVAFWFTVWTIIGLTVGRSERARDAS